MQKLYWKSIRVKKHLALALDMVHIKILSESVFLCCMFQCFLLQSIDAQVKIQKHILENTHKIQSIHPDSTRYGDLEIIGKAIGDARVVMLGEQDHGDAPAFLAKTRLIRYLHEQKGFNVLAFESDFFALNNGWEKTPKTRSAIASFLKENIFGIWSACSECRYLLYDYVPKTFETDNPLHITGFDSQLILTHSHQFLSHKLDSIFKVYDLPLTRSPDYEREILPVFSNWNIATKDTALSRKYLLNLYRIDAELGAHLPQDDFWAMTVRNFIQMMQQYRSIDYSIVREKSRCNFSVSY